MNERIRLWWPLAAITTFTVLGLAKTAYEVSRRPADAWGSDLRVRLLQAEARDNPGHKILNPELLEMGIERHLPSPTPTGQSNLTLRWDSQPFACEMRNEKDPGEDGEAFANRSGLDATAMLRAFPAR